MSKEEFLSGQPFKKKTGTFHFYVSGNQIYSCDPQVAASQHSFKVVNDEELELTGHSPFGNGGRPFTELQKFSDYELI